MPRQARLRVAGIPWHVRQRANNGIACFVEPADRELYLGLLGELSPKTGCHVHAYVLMTNHTHLLLTPEDADGPSRLMKQLGERYTRHFNTRRKRYGTLWEGRFRSNLVQGESYLLTCHRYIELNPVRAGMVRSPEEFQWSSFRQNASGDPGGLVSAHPEYLALGADRVRRRMAYMSLFGGGIRESDLAAIRESSRMGRALGSERFCAALESTLRRPVRVVRQGRPPRRP